MNPIIVCATDFSSQAEGALAWAAALARRDGGSVDLVHVVPVGNDVAGLFAFDLVGVDDTHLEEMTLRLREVARAVGHEYDILVRPHLLKGVTHEELLKHARDNDARMLVLGTGGLSTLDRWTMGSVSERVLRSAVRPVVLVPGRLERNAWWTAGAGPERRVPRVIAALGDHDDTSILSFAADLRRIAPCDVTFLHLYWPLEEYARLGLQGSRDLFKADPDVVKSLEPALRAKTDGLPGRGDVSLDIRPAWGEPASNLLLAVGEGGADLLVVGAHQRHGLARFLSGSVAERLARQARYVAVAVVPAAPTAASKPGAIPALRTVLAVTDFSDLGNAAVAHAFGLVRQTCGVVELCHIYEHALPTPAYSYEDQRARIADGDRARLLKDLRALVPAEAEGLGIATHVSIVDGGKAAEAIVQAAERLDVDAIVLASHGRGGLAGTVLGSVTQEVVDRAHRPVYVVRAR